MMTRTALFVAAAESSSGASFGLCFREFCEAAGAALVGMEKKYGVARPRRIKLAMIRRNIFCPFFLRLPLDALPASGWEREPFHF
jgi:hypothetical protein